MLCCAVSHKPRISTTKNYQPQTSISYTMQLPTELLETCFQFLTDQRDLFACAGVDHYWSSVARRVLALDDDAILRAVQSRRSETTDRIMTMGTHTLQFRDLATVAAHGHERLVRRLLENPAILREWKCTPLDSRGRSPLVAGIISQNTDIIGLLKPAQVKLMAPDWCGWTPIRAICAMGTREFEALAKLYKSGHDIGGVDSRKDGYNDFKGPTSISDMQKRLLEMVLSNGELQPLHVAALANSVAMAEAALEQGADVNQRTTTGHTPLALAAYEGSLDVATLLVKKGADVMCRSNNDSIPLHLTNHPEIARLLLGHGTVEVTRAYRKMELEWTLWGYNPVSVIAGHISPLMRACEAGNGRVVKTLLEAGADPMVLNKGRFTTLHAAAAMGLVSAVKLLADAGVPVNSITHDSSPLHAAAKAGDTEMVRTLIELGADVHAVAENGLKVIHVAAVVPDLIQLLVDSGLDINSQWDKDGTTLFHAMRADPYDLAANLDRLVALGADLSVIDHKGNTAMHCAVRHGCLKYVKALQRHRASIDALNYDGYNPLAMACHCKQQRVLRHLIASGATIDAAEGKALNVACRKDVECVIALIEAGADPRLITVRLKCRAVKKVLKRGGRERPREPDSGVNSASVEAEEFIYK